MNICTGTMDMDTVQNDSSNSNSIQPVVLVETVLYSSRIFILDPGHSKPLRCAQHRPVTSSTFPTTTVQDCSIRVEYQVSTTGTDNTC
jgi:hypothetical protein